MSFRDKELDEQFHRFRPAALLYFEALAQCELAENHLAKDTQSVEKLVVKRVKSDAYPLRLISEFAVFLSNLDLAETNNSNGNVVYVFNSFERYLVALADRLKAVRGRPNGGDGIIHRAMRKGFSERLRTRRKASKLSRKLDDARLLGIAERYFADYVATQLEQEGMVVPYSNYVSWKQYKGIAGYDDIRWPPGTIDHIAKRIGFKGKGTTLKKRLHRVKNRFD
jgi:hypothetical protein